MLFNYLIVAVRNLLRSRVYAFINVAGLAIGLACTMLLGLFVHHEWNHDRFHERKDKIYRVIAEYHRPKRVERLGLLNKHVGPLIKEAVPDFKYMTHSVPDLKSRKATTTQS